MLPFVPPMCPQGEVHRLAHQPIGPSPAPSEKVTMWSDPDSQAMLQLMEGHVARLSEALRARESDVARLQLGVQQACEERQQLVQQLQQLQQVLRQQAPHVQQATGSGSIRPPVRKAEAAATIVGGEADRGAGGLEFWSSLAGVPALAARMR